jgi:hypothetical protein
MKEDAPFKNFGSASSAAAVQPPQDAACIQRMEYERFMDMRKHRQCVQFGQVLMKATRDKRILPL